MPAETDNPSVAAADSGKTRAMEVIWGNRLQAGEYKYIGSFPHYVARGGEANIGRWFDEEIDLAAIYTTIWPDESIGTTTNIALFCDSDNTDGHSVSYFANVVMKKKE